MVEERAAPIVSTKDCSVKYSLTTIRRAIEELGYIEDVEGTHADVIWWQQHHHHASQHHTCHPIYTSSSDPSFFPSQIRNDGGVSRFNISALKPGQRMSRFAGLQMAVRKVRGVLVFA